MKIDNETRKRIRDALLHAYRSHGELEMLVQDVLDVRLWQEAAAPNVPLGQAMFSLINWLEGEGRLVELVLKAADRKPGNPMLRPLVADIRRAIPITGDRPFAGEDYKNLLPKDAPANFESLLLAEVTFQDIGPWLQKMTRRRRTVCRVEPRPHAEGLNGYGSGFLVAPNVVMTNCHVIDGFPDGEGLTRVRLRFDYEAAMDGVAVQPGREVALAADWKLLSSPSQELDFALIRLAEAVGNDPIAGTSRGAMSLIASPNPYVFVNNEPLLILQHPRAQPLKMAIGSVTTPDLNQASVGYNVNTEGGSSGSPVLNHAAEAVALHSRSGNSGIRFGAICAFLSREENRELLKAKGLEGLLG